MPVRLEHDEQASPLSKTATTDIQMNDDSGGSESVGASLMMAIFKFK
ncbi:hypothetical protein RI536_03655 [Lactiplantibacillus pentosus]|uniref:Uncharacterized protein n=1 Tax=Lactiplantibacillus pentosus TaxID=1589 RepID=A0AAW8VUJ3_LACPE|nr:hypothetical protein [Lactiplantibacillus pentosus]